MTNTLQEWDNWYQIEDVDLIDSPALLIYPERVKQNIDQLRKEFTDLSRLRPHIKTLKSAEPVRLMMAVGIRKFKCATIAEAELLAMCGAQDVLLAYQPTETKLKRLLALIKQYPTTYYSCLVDNEDTGQLFSKMALEAGIVLPVYIDINAGMDRTGILPDLAGGKEGKQLVALYEDLSRLDGIEVKGLHCYDGHIRATDYAARNLECNRYFESTENARTVLEEKGYGYPLLIAGGSPTYRIHLERKHTEVSPGTFGFWDYGYHIHLPEQSFHFAALVLTRVISLPAPGKICIDLGYKSIASENPLDHRVHFLNAPDLVPHSHSEEHMVIEAGPDHGFKVGDVLYALPYHICPTVALYEYGNGIVAGKLSTEWKIIARNRKLTI